MSSATSIKAQGARPVRLKPDATGREVRLKPDATERRPIRPKPDATASGDGVRQADQTDAGFRPWHFFVLMSLVAATAAVVLSRQATPQHLILLSVTIAAAGVAAAAFYRTLAPLAAEDVSIFSDPLTERARAALEREKALVLRAIKELEFDRSMGKLSQKDFDEMSGRLRARAYSLMKQLDDEGSGYRGVIERELRERVAKNPKAAQAASKVEAAPLAQSETACACGASNDADALFCKRCGTKLDHAVAAGDVR